MKTKLYSEYDYDNANPDMINFICNGCGPAKIGGLVPDRILFLNINGACKIHDWMYHFGETLEDKKRADRVFLNNMTRIIDDAESWGWLRKARLRIAYGYYLSVKRFGGPAFWSGKNTETDSNLARPLVEKISYWDADKTEVKERYFLKDGKKHGEHKFYTPDGKSLRTDFYENGFLIKRGRQK